MTELPMEQVTLVWYYDVEKLLKELFGKDANIIQAEDCYNDSYQTVNAEEIVWNEQEEHILSWLNDEAECLNAQEAMYLLYKEGHIPAGKYVVTLSW